MDVDAWKNSVLDVVRRISDSSYQERSWFGTEDVASSPDELYCELFDDYIFDEFLASPDITLTDIQRNLGIELKLKLNEYSDLIGECADPRIVYEDPRWHAIRTLARSFLESF